MNPFLFPFTKDWTLEIFFFHLNLDFLCLFCWFLFVICIVQHYFKYDTCSVNLFLTWLINLFGWTAYNLYDDTESEREREKIYFIWLFIYICLSWILHSLVFHINNSIRFINGKKYSPIKLLFTVSNYSYMHKIHVINYLRIYKEQLFCRKIGDTCHTQYRTHAHTHTHTHRLKRMACGSLYIYTVHVFYNDGKFSPVPILWQFVYSVFFFCQRILVSLSLAHSRSWFWI